MIFHTGAQTQSSPDAGAMTDLLFGSKGELIVAPSTDSSESDFDFLIGNYKVRHRKLVSRLNDCNDWIEFNGQHEMHKILNGIGNLETHYMPGPDGENVEAVALRLFNPATKLWSIYWADSDAMALDVPVVGSFDKTTGRFFCQDTFNDKKILVQFLWNISDPVRPVWSQAFSADDGKTWEWNWHMHFTKDETKAKTENDSIQPPGKLNKPKDSINLIELRNYVLKPGLRDRFIGYFEDNFVQSQNELGAYILGEYRVKGAEDHFFWMRGFHDMASRGKFLTSFYYGSFWKAHRDSANAMLANNDNVYLLKPLTVEHDTLISGKGIDIAQLKKNKGIAVIDFYVANTKLDKLRELFSKDYLPLVENAGIKDYSLWESELEENNFPQLPVFQDKNLLVAISFFQDEEEYREKQKQLEASISADLKDRMMDVITTKNSLVIYPAKKVAKQSAGSKFDTPKTKPIHLAFENHVLQIKASPGSSKDDYDFLMGRHTVHHKILESRLTHSRKWIEADGWKETTKILKGMGNVEYHFFTMPDGTTREGVALRLFDPVKKLWSLYWADGKHGTLDTPQLGSFENNLGVFLAKDIFKGQEIITQFQYDKTDADKPTWGQAFSVDNGKTWEWNWFMYYNQ